MVLDFFLLYWTGSAILEGLEGQHKHFRFHNSLRAQPPRRRPERSNPIPIVTYIERSCRVLNKGDYVGSTIEFNSIDT